DVTDDDRKKIREHLDDGMVKVEALDSTQALHIIAELRKGDEYAIVEVIDTHTNFGHIELNGKILNERKEEEQKKLLDHEVELTLKNIVDFANEVDLDDVRDVLERQINYNGRISNEGLENNWGACVGKTLMACNDSLYTRMKAGAAAGSDARMNGCLLPVVINSGSGNQGITVSVPLIIYAKEKGYSHEELLRALCMANLTALHIKGGIGRLSAFCGALCAATAAAAGVAYLDKADYEVIAQTIVNSLADVGGMVCDGAKSSCAAKIASSLDCSLMSYEMAKKNHGFRDGEGIVKADVEKTISSVGRMARKGMRSTDREILSIMLEQ
ncbi:MAG: serine dehydratase subunit alpha family protein, partial [Erysipelotrichaceae bacterium]|nr:serine dehydratase subunit alpha family protein [Erysipelotrichaceae bacterium]